MEILERSVNIPVFCWFFAASPPPANTLNLLPLLGSGLPARPEVRIWHVRRVGVYTALRSRRLPGAAASPFL